MFIFISSANNRKSYLSLLSSNPQLTWLNICSIPILKANWINVIINKLWLTTGYALIVFKSNFSYKIYHQFIFNVCIFSTCLSSKRILWTKTGNDAESHSLLDDLNVQYLPYCCVLESDYFRLIVSY